MGVRAEIYKKCLELVNTPYEQDLNKIPKDVMGPKLSSEDAHLKKTKLSDELTEIICNGMMSFKNGDAVIAEGKKVKVLIANPKENKKMLTEDQIKSEAREWEALYPEAKKLAEETKWVIELTKNFKRGLKKFMDREKQLKTSEILINYYNKQDMIALIQTRIGKIVDVYEKPTTKDVDVVNDSFSRVREERSLWKGSKYHSVNDFILFLDKNHNISAGKIGINFLRNMVKTAMLSNKGEAQKKWKREFNENLKIDEEGVENVIKSEIKGYIKKLRKEEKNLEVEDRYLQGENTFSMILDEEWLKFYEKGGKKIENEKGGKKIENEKEEKKIEKLMVIEKVDKGYNITFGEFNNLMEIRGIEGGDVEIVD